MDLHTSWNDHHNSEHASSHRYKIKEIKNQRIIMCGPSFNQMTPDWKQKWEFGSVGLDDVS